jgi:hypothetical protein
LIWRPRRDSNPCYRRERARLALKGSFRNPQEHLSNLYRTQVRPWFHSAEVRDVRDQRSQSDCDLRITACFFAIKPPGGIEPKLEERVALLALVMVTLSDSGAEGR